MSNLNNVEEDIEIIYWGEEEEDSTVNSERFKKKRKKEKSDWKSDLLDWLKIIAIAVGIAFVINYFVIINSEVPTGSMIPTIQKNTRMIGSRWSYVFSDVKRGDIVIFKFPDDEKQIFVKRVIGLPGETIEIKAGIVFINDVPLEEDYAYFSDGLVKNNGDYPKTVIPKDCYFVLGDNRNNSKDSRLWTTTPFVKKSQIVGRALFTYYPKFKWLN